MNQKPERYKKTSKGVRHPNKIPVKEKKHVKIREVFTYETSYNYSINDLMNYEPLLESKIRGPEQERSLISDLTAFLSSDELALQGYIPLRNVYWTRKFGNIEVDLLQDALLTRKGVIATFRYEVKNKQLHNRGKISRQLTNMKNVHPIWVESITSQADSRLEWLIRNVQGADGFMLRTPKHFITNLSLDKIPSNPVIDEIKNYGFTDDLDLMITAYSLFSNLRLNNEPINTSFNHGLILLNSAGISFSNQPLNEQSNFVITTNPEKVSGYADSIIILNPYSNHLIEKVITRDDYLKKLFKNFIG